MFSNIAGLGGSGMPGGGDGGPPVAEEMDDGKMLDLGSRIDTAQCYARNAASAFPMSNLFIGDTRLGCKSDADEQLIIHVEFHEFVKVHSIKITEFNNGVNPEMNPSKVNLYVNRESFGFEDAEDIDPTQVLTLTAEDLKESADPLLLKFVRFQRVRSITLFIEDNQGGDVTALGQLKFFGRPLATTNMKDFKKQNEAG